VSAVRFPVAGLLAALLLPYAATGAQTVLTPPPTRGPGSVTLFTQGRIPPTPTVSGGPAVTTIDWSVLSGNLRVTAQFYSLQRWKESDLTCCNAQWDGLRSFQLVDEGAPWPGKYIYRLTAFYSNGSVGSIDAPYAPPAPVNPTGFHGTLANGVVTLRWNTVPNVSWYDLSGPQIPNGSFQVAPTTTFFLVRNLPAGTHTWRLGSVYSSKNAPQAVSTPSAQFAVVTVIVP
jgi:hypothetical protein